MNKKKRKKLGHMVAPVHNIDPKILPRISEAVMGGAGGRGPHISASVVQWKEKSP
jgi:hypothetical protein